MSKNEIVKDDARSLGIYLSEEIDCVITDPPYGVGFQSNFAATNLGKRLTRPISGDEDVASALCLFDDVMQVILPRLAVEADLYVFTSWGVKDHWTNLLDSYDDLTRKMEIIWAKGWPGLGDLEANWGCGYETILYYKKGRRPVNYRRSAILHYDQDLDAEIAEAQARLEVLKDMAAGSIASHYETGVVSIDKPATSKHVHPTEKPVALIEELVRMSTSPGDLVVDPFSGSGSTSVACQRLDRNSLALEIDPEYVKVGRGRLASVGLF